MRRARQFALPLLSPRLIAVWRRNFLVWRKLAVPSILGNLADPLIMLFGLGYGLGAVMGNLAGTSYFAFLAAGFAASATMYAATFEALFSAFSRMHVQKTWEAIVNAPMTLDDVLAGEWLWAATKALAAGLCMIAVISAFGYASYPLALAAIPVLVLAGLAFAALGLAVNALASGYDFFSYYLTLVLTPMMMLSGVFFPVEQLPGPIQLVAAALPLHHAVQLVRPLLSGVLPAAPLLHAGVLAGYAALGFYAATVLTRRRLLS
ncbi:MAG: nodulation protein NodJ [Betaproteobacteria bacterium]|nr:MAG: nodulation protein NodJ [Betaproteobacteria bacterium]TAN50935.1 MAG: nodulation protein NodJ [Betaproteobacteria bacterium]